MGHDFFFYYSLWAVRYVILSGGAFLLFWVLFKNVLKKRRIQDKVNSRQDYLREIASSLFTFVFFGIEAVIILETPFKNYTQVYDNFNEYGAAYFIFSIFAALVFHDTYFYWMHRAVHHPKLFKKIHLTHHKSTNPSPWASFAFHPWEAILEAFVVFPIVLLMPIHPYALLLFLVLGQIYNVYGHLGYEIYPKWFVESRIGRWFNTSLNHNMHHQFFKGNYGLYFRFWDEWMGTTHPQYDERMKKLQAG
ncbi:MAG TPA: sterol desaturase family protein [Patescibacteria group bacterium]|nr:sterol desaturase family protein [Patescibacteria group bacterium]